MAKKQGRNKDEHKVNAIPNGAVTIVPQQKLDPKLTQLFSSSFGPVQRKGRQDHQKGTLKGVEDNVGDDANKPSSEISFTKQPERSESGENYDEEGGDVKQPATDTATLNGSNAQGGAKRSSRRKREREGDNDDLEEVYMRKLEREEVKEQLRRRAEKSRKRAKIGREGDGEEGSILESSNSELGSQRSDVHESAEDIIEETKQTEPSRNDSDGLHNNDEYQIPQHESLMSGDQKGDIEKPLRTVFVSNISIDAMTSKSSKKALLKHFSSFLPELSNDTGPHKLESIRFRSTAYSNSMPRKAAYVAKDLMSATTKSTNAYIVYTSKSAAREAAKRLNGMVVLDRHVRVDEVAHPAKVDHKRCVFVGNLGYVDDESNVVAAANNNGDGSQEDRQKRPKKARQPGDVEEGLWRQFSRAGTVESVRVVRDAKTRVGKGFAYVQFTDSNAVEAALLYNEKSFPPLLCRKLRVVRAKAVKRNKASPSSSYAAFKSSRNTAYIDPKLRSKQGRALGMLGRAGAAQVWKQQKRENGRTEANINGNPNGGHRQERVFEGMRARKEDRVNVKGRKKGNSKSKRQGRRRERTTAWKTRSKA